MRLFLSENRKIFLSQCPGRTKFAAHGTMVTSAVVICAASPCPKSQSKVSSGYPVNGRKEDNS